MRLKLIQRFEAKGHKNVLGTHKSTIEFTKDRHLTKKGDCILGVNSSIGCFGLNADTKRELRVGQEIHVKLISGGFEDIFTGFGHPSLDLSDVNDLVFRKSEYICGRTILISCSKGARELDRELVGSLKKQDSRITVELYSISED